jgi:hypothetical protein
MTLKWKLALIKTMIVFVKSPLKNPSASASLRRDQKEVKS